VILRIKKTRLTLSGLKNLSELVGDMEINLNTVVTVLGCLGGIIGVWTTLNTRLTTLEARIQFGDERFQSIDRRFDEMMSHLRRIEDRLQKVSER
jgi:hypothetical protein